MPDQDSKRLEPVPTTALSETIITSPNGALEALRNTLIFLSIIANNYPKERLEVLVVGPGGGRDLLCLDAVIYTQCLGRGHRRFYGLGSYEG